MNSIRSASAVVVGAHAMADLASKANPVAGVTADTVLQVALSEGPGAVQIRGSLAQIATNEKEWFRTTAPHVQATERILDSRIKEVHGLSALNQAVLAAVEFAPAARTGDPEALSQYQTTLETAMQAIDGLPVSTNERRGHLKLLRDQSMALAGDPSFVDKQVALAQQAYLARFMTERLAAYESPTP